MLIVYGWYRLSFLMVRILRKDTWASGALTLRLRMAELRVTDAIPPHYSRGGMRSIFRPTATNGLL